MKRLLILSLILLSNKASAQRTVCTVTLNSEHERSLFKRKYEKENLKFVELTDFKNGLKDPNDWFDNACKSGVKCDSLIISGHFGGTFFGEDTSLTLSLKTLEKKACSRTCEGILSQPKEVYLFGCNTLADKKADRRTPAEYRRILQDDGIAEGYMNRIVAARYSPVGESFKTTMRKVFAGVPQIYGFDSVGPSGKTVSSFLNSYLNKIPNYAERLNQLEAAKVVSQIEKTGKIGTQFSGPWNSSMKGTAYASCVGATPGPRKECGLSDDKKSDFEKLLTVESLLNDGNRKNHFLAIEEFFKDKDLSRLSSDERQVLERIHNNKQASQELLSLLPQLNSVLETKFPLVNLAQTLGWMDEKSAKDEYFKTVSLSLKKGLNGDTIGSLCYINNPPIFSESQIKPEWFNNTKFLTVLGCWQNNKAQMLPPHYVTNITKHLNSKDADTTTSALKILSPNLKADPALQRNVAKLLYSEDLNIAAAAMSALASIRNPDAETISLIAKGLLSPNPAEQKRSAYTIMNMKIQNPDLKRRALEIDPSIKP
ncbi:hypothetical protein [Bdellovibrio sp. BCCA]|uniref:hypothetical protein n=1 Tax=Bdellovibrio sp. BCCA TaxID=3136281 RepID=UPI0030F1FA19